MYIYTRLSFQSASSSSRKPLCCRVYICGTTPPIVCRCPQRQACACTSLAITSRTYQHTHLHTNTRLQCDEAFTLIATPQEETGLTNVKFINKTVQWLQLTILTKIVNISSNSSRNFLVFLQSFHVSKPFLYPQVQIAPGRL